MVVAELTACPDYGNTSRKMFMAFHRFARLAMFKEILWRESWKILLRSRSARSIVDEAVIGRNRMMNTFLLAVNSGSGWSPVASSGSRDVETQVLLPELAKPVAFNLAYE
jgi:hypothetical protein